MEPESRVFRSSFPEGGPSGFRSAVWKHGVPGADEPVQPLFPTLVAMLQAAREFDDDVGITLLNDDASREPEHKSYVSIELEVNELAARLHGRGVRRGDCVLMVFPTGFDFILSFFALLRLGAVPVPSYPPPVLEKAELAIERLGYVARHAKVTHCLTTGVLVPLLGDLVRQAETLRDLVAIDRLRQAAAPEPMDFAEIRTSDTAFIQYTSGSTAQPKGVHLTHRAIMCNMHCIGQGMRVTRSDVGVSWLPLYHDMGLVGGLLTAIYFHIPLVLMSPMAFLEEPARWLRAISKYRGTITVAPNFGYARCVKRIAPDEREGLDLSSLRVAMNGAEAINYRTLVDFERAFGPYGYDPRAMFPVYGQAESVVAVTFPTPFEPVRFVTVDRNALANGHVVPAKGVGSMSIVGVGRAMPGHRVVVLDEDGKEVPESVVGHIVVRGPSIMKGYYRSPEETARVLHDGWLWTGDLGFFEGGSLFVTGRAKDLIIVRGRNHYPEDIERVAERVEGVRAGATAGFAVYDEEKAVDLAVLVVETKVEDPEAQAALAARVQDSVSAHCGLKVDEIVLVPPGTIPKTSSGKRQRGLTRARYLSRELVAPKKKAGSLRMAMVFVRSGAGLLKLLSRKIAPRRREPS